MDDEVQKVKREQINALLVILILILLINIVKHVQKNIYQIKIMTMKMIMILIVLFQNLIEDIALINLV